MNRIAAMSAFLLALGLQSQAMAVETGGPGGQTVGGGFERSTTIMEGAASTVFQCLGCDVAACITVQRLNSGEVFLEGTDLVRQYVPKDGAMTRCNPHVKAWRLVCYLGAGNCEVVWRVDQTGALTPDPQPTRPFALPE